MKKIVRFAAFPLLLILFIYGWFLVEYNSVSSPTKGEPVSLYQNDKKALLVVDVQQAITGEVATFRDIDQAGINTMIPNINKIISRARDLDMEVIYIQMFYKKNTLLNFLTQGALEEGSAGINIDSRIHVVNGNIFFKHKMDAFSNPGLDSFLRDRQIGKLYIAGLETNMCVDRTVWGAKQRGYEVNIITDAAAAQNDQVLNKAFEKFEKNAITLVSSDNLVRGAK